MPDETLKAAIEDSLAQGRLPCERAFAIAERLGVPVGRVGAACEAMEIRISDCQLGCFGRRKKKG